jgi:hypothetical protein
MAGSMGSCESELLLLGDSEDRLRREFVGLLRELAEYRAKGLGPMRTHILLSLGRICSDPRTGPGCRAFARGLAGDLGIGMEIGSGSQPEAEPPKAL